MDKLNWENIDDSELIDCDQYCDLLVSRRRIRRFELEDGELIALVDLVSGDRFFIKREQLFAERQTV